MPGIPDRKGKRKGRPARARRPRTRAKSPTVRFALIVALLTTASAAMLWRYLGVSVLWGYLVGINLSTCALYVYDKRAARASALRVPERLLHLVALLGGTPAAFICQETLRHKTAKRSFRRWFGIIVLVQAVALFSLSPWRWLF